MGAPPLIPDATSGVTPALRKHVISIMPGRPSGAVRWVAGMVPAGALFALPVAAVAAPSPAPSPAPAPSPGLPQTVSSAAPPPAATAGRAASPGQAVANAYPVLTENDELILEIRTQHREMTDTITAHGTRGAVYLPLGDLARFLDLQITISDDGNYASGWYLSPSRTISINLRAGTITQGGKEAPLPKRDFAAHDGEMWIRADRLADILPIAVLTDLRAQTVVIKTLERFPFEQRLDRENARERLANAGGHAPPPTYPRQQTPYHLFDAPIGEVELRAAGSDGIRTHVESDLRASGDLLFMTARAYASLSSADGLVAARLQLGRRDPDARLLGPLHATEFALGDVASASLPLGLRGVAGRGFALTNEPLERASVFEKMDFRGELPSGFEVELYRNDTLVGSTRDAVAGQYEFLHVPVDFGLNVFRLVFYGPQGQRREEVRRISVGDGRLAKGAFTYNVFAVQRDKTLINVSPPGFQPSQGYGTWRGGVAMQYGLTSALTVVGSGALYQWGGRSQWLASAGLRSGLGGFAAKLDAAIGSGGGTAVELGVAGRLLGASVVATHAEYGHGFIDEVRSPGNLPLKSMSQFDLAKTLHVGNRTFPLAFSWQRLAYANGQVSNIAAFHQTMTVGRVMATNVINYTDTASPGTATTHTTTGTFDLATFAGSHTQFRGQVGYSLGPRPGLTSLGGELARDIGHDTTVRAGINRTFDNHQTTLGLSATRKFGPVALAFDSTYVMPIKSFAFTLRLGVSFGRNPLSGRMFVARPGLSSSGAVAVRAFTDSNGNGVFDPGEETIANAAFFTASQHVTAGRDGTAMLTGIGDGNRTAVRIDSASLPDIAMAPARPGVEIVARPGRIPVVDFAIERLSDIEATAVYADGSHKRGVAGLVLQLVDRNGRLMAHARSENDGFTLMEQIRPGDYTLQIAPDQARNLKIRLVSDGHVHVGIDGKPVRMKIVVAPQ